MIVVDKEKFNSLAAEFYNACKVRLVLYDEVGNLIYKAPNMNPICTALWKSPTLHERCREANMCGIRACYEKQGIHIYTCHIGFREVVTPIRMQDVTIGYLMFGQVVDETVDTNALRKMLIQKCETHKLDTALVLQKLDDIEVRRSDEIASIAVLMDMCYRYMLLNDIIAVKELSLPQLLKIYIDSNYAQNLTTETLCSALGISRSLLYKISKETFGCGVSQYITVLRIEKAKTLLQSGDMKVSEVAAAVGIPDYSYFTKVFKKTTGQTPKWYIPTSNI